MRILLAAIVLAACSSPPTTRPKDAAPANDVPRGDVLLVANKSVNTLSIVELSSGRIVATLPTGEGPHEIAVSPDGRTAVITNYGTDTVGGRSLTIVDLPRLAVSKTIDLDPHRRPHGVSFLPGGRRVIVTSETSGALLVVDLDSGSVTASIATGGKGSHMVALTADGGRAYTGNMESGTVTAIDVVGGKAMASAPAVKTCEGIATTPGGETVWTASMENGGVVVLDGKDLSKLAEFPTGAFPIRVVMTPDAAHVLVSTAGGSAIEVFDVASRAAAGKIELPNPKGGSAEPVGIVVSADSRTAYVALSALDHIAEIDLVARREIRRLTGFKHPDGLALSSAFR